jgi:DNA-binding CsgD family transcriptional regulator/tetratricopeptide (TPR) repeat protein
MPDAHPGAALRGRRRECQTLDRLLNTVRDGQSSVLALRGEAGVGKTALLEYVREHAVGFRVARALGVESEMELAFAGLHQVCLPLLGRLEYLPGPQREALRIAFELDHGGAPDRFLVGLAVLSLLSDAADEQPLLVLVDDAHWIDRASTQSFAFVARRLMAEPVALMFAVREPNDDQDLAGLPALQLDGIPASDAQALLASSLHERLDTQVRNRILAEARGNPLALLELPRNLAPAELAGGFAVPDERRLETRIEASFRHRLTSLPAATQLFLLTAAAEPVGDDQVVWRASDLVGVGRDAAAPAVSDGLIALHPRIRFRHGLVRSAVYRSASFNDRRRVHHALAEATDPRRDADRRAWHRAHASLAPDEDVATELEQSADRAHRRGGVAAAAAFLERAAELSPDPAARGRRALAAAYAKSDAGAFDAAHELLGTAATMPLDALAHARLEQLSARIAFARRRGRDAPPLLLAAAKRLEVLDARLAREAYLEALSSLMFVGRFCDPADVVATTQSAERAPPAPNRSRPVDLLLDGLVARFVGDYAAAVAPLRRAVGAYRAREACDEEQLRWLWLAARLAGDLWDDAAWDDLSARHVATARDAGALSALPIAVSFRAGVLLHRGEFAAAAAMIEEADAISEATGNAPFIYASLVLAAWRGHTDTALDLIADGVRSATARGEGRGIALTANAAAVLHNALGNYDLALEAALRACEHHDIALHAWSLIEVVEAAARTGRTEVAASALHELTEGARASGTDWALGCEARSRALVSDGPRADALYREAITRLANTMIAIHLARAHLVYGEWLRHQNRRVEARAELRIAYDAFTTMGADAFTDRARRELVATGGVVRERPTGELDKLTAQEAQVARLAAEGLTNIEIGGRIFISARTAEWHLHNVFAKLDIRSRKELRDALPAGHADPAGPGAAEPRSTRP